MSKDISWYILNRIIEKHEKSTSDWRGETEGNRSFKIQQSDYDAFGKSELIKEARELERRRLIRAAWFSGGSEIEKITYRLKDMPEIYRIAEREPKSGQMQRARQRIQNYENQAESLWLKNYYGELLREIENGRYPDDLSRYGEALFQCLNVLEQLREPIYNKRLK